MTYFLLILVVAIVVTGFCLLAMGVGVIFRGKCFKSCGCASMEFNGERIECPGHVADEEPEPGRCDRSGELCANSGTCSMSGDCAS